MSALRELTITTACDSNYFWGAFLMVGTLRQHGMDAAVHVLGKDFTDEQKRLLAQFDRVSVLPLPANSRNLTTSKPDALLTATTEWVSWVDADCVFTGDLSSALIPPNGEVQVRMRGEAENGSVYRDSYVAGEPRRGVARKVLETWQADVGDLAAPRLDTTVAANVLVIGNRFRPFIELWRRQMDKVLATGMTGVVDWKNRAYFQTDESVLNSLLTFSSLAPKVERLYLLDRIEGAHIGHFIGSPKPWRRWNWRALNWYETVLSFLDWCVQHGYQTPPVPPSFLRSHKPRAYAMAAAEQAFVLAKRRAGAFVRTRFPRGRPV